ncbi:MAG: hypothetical protein VZS12_10515 [Ruminococcus bromii]|nr:hypothetical protein [Ruminococcus bromii]
MKPLAFFLIEWITDYINTPKIEQTPQQEILYYTAIAIWLAVLLTIYVIIANLISWKRGGKK